jgi:UDP-N-acetylmuramate dehydrogenase
MTTTIMNVESELTGILGAENVRPNERVARYTTWRVGGPAALLCVATSADLLCRAAETLRDAAVPWLVLGRGSNLLVDDTGFDGVVVVNRADAVALDGTAVQAESGASLAALARRTAAAGLAGLEWCHDIPGSVGGAVVNNAGANGGAIADVLRAVRVLPVTGAPREIAAAELDLGYRRSMLRAEGHAQPGPRPVVLCAFFALERGDAPALKARIAAQREHRKATQPGGASAGSVFKNPPGDSAGRLVESAGLKGTRHGDATVSTLHANFIVNGPRATAADVLALVALMRRRVREEHGIELEPEVQYVQRDGRIGPPPPEEP